MLSPGLSPSRDSRPRRVCLATRRAPGRRRRLKQRIRGADRQRLSAAPARADAAEHHPADAHRAAREGHHLRQHHVESPGLRLLPMPRPDDGLHVGVDRSSIGRGSRRRGSSPAGADTRRPMTYAYAAFSPAGPLLRRRVRHGVGRRQLLGRSCPRHSRPRPGAPHRPGRDEQYPRQRDLSPLAGGIPPSSSKRSRHGRIRPLFKQIYGQDVFTKYTARSSTALIARGDRGVRGARARSASSARSTTPPSMACRRRTCTRSPPPRSGGGNSTSAVGPNATRSTAHCSECHSSATPRP